MPATPITRDSLFNGVLSEGPILSAKQGGHVADGGFHTDEGGARDNAVADVELDDLRDADDRSHVDIVEAVTGKHLQSCRRSRTGRGRDSIQLRLDCRCRWAAWRPNLAMGSPEGLDYLAMGSPEGLDYEPRRLLRTGRC